MTAKKLIIGIGSGRCGTHSLAAFLNAQPDCQCSHEMTPLLPWDGSHPRKRFDERVARLLAREAGFVGDVALFNLKYVPLFLERSEDCAVIALKRDRTETVQSFGRWLHKNGWNHWSKGHAVRSEWDICFPKYEVRSLEEACGFYWDDYYAEVDALMQRYPGRVRLWSIDALNQPSQLDELLNFVGYPKRGRRLKPFHLAVTPGRDGRYRGASHLRALRGLQAS